MRCPRISSIPAEGNLDFSVVGASPRPHPADPPARTVAAVASRPWQFDIEIECVALA